MSDINAAGAEELFDILPDFVVNSAGQPKYLRVQKQDGGAVIAKYGGHLYATAGTDMRKALFGLAIGMIHDGYRFVDGKLLEPIKTANRY